MKKSLFIPLLLTFGGCMQNPDTAMEHSFEQIFPQGEKLPEQFSQYFIGQAWLARLTADPALNCPVSNVTFEPGCRNNWHIHHAKSGGGQILICVDGEGWYQEDGKPARSLKPGDAVTIPAGVKHWHGAKADCWFSHLAVERPGEDASNEWLEPVTDEAYDALPFRGRGRAR